MSLALPASFLPQGQLGGKPPLTLVDAGRTDGHATASKSGQATQRRGLEADLLVSVHQVKSTYQRSAPETTRRGGGASWRDSMEF